MLNALRPSSDIKMLLETENKLGQVDTEWRIGLAMFNEKHYSEAIEHFSAVLNLSSGHLLAQQYKALASRIWQTMCRSMVNALDFPEP